MMTRAGWTMTDAESGRLVKAWARLVERQGPFDWFVTLTFANPVGARTATDRWTRWTRLLQRDLYGPSWRRMRDVFGHGLVLVVAIERQRRGVIHFHSLMAGPDLAAVNRFRWERIWRGVADGKPDTLELDRQGFLFVAGEVTRNPRRNWARIEIPRSGAVANYCAKYVGKEGRVDIDRPSRSRRRTRLRGRDGRCKGRPAVDGDQARSQGRPIAESISGGLRAF